MAYDQQGLYQQPPIYQNRTMLAGQIHGSSGRDDRLIASGAIQHRADVMNGEGRYRSSPDHSHPQSGRPGGDNYVGRHGPPYPRNGTPSGQEEASPRQQRQLTQPRSASNGSDGFNRHIGPGIARNESPQDRRHIAPYPVAPVNRGSPDYPAKQLDAQRGHALNNQPNAVPPMANGLRQKPRPLGPRSPSPDLTSWDNPFPVFPGVKKKDGARGKQGVEQLMSGMSLRDKPQNQDQLNQNRPQTSESRSSQSSSGSHQQRARGMERQGYVSNLQERSRAITPPGQLPRGPYPNREQTPSGGQMAQGRHPARHMRPGDLPELNIQQSRLEHGPPGSFSSSRSAVDNPSSRIVEGDRSALRTRTYGAAGVEARMAYPGNDQWGQTDTSVFTREYRGRGAPSSQSAVTHTERPPMVPRAYSEDAKYVQDQTASFNSPASREVQGYHMKQESVGDVLNSYYEPADDSYELPTEEHPALHEGHRSPEEEEMPNFEAATFTASGHRRGMSLEHHLPSANNTYVPYVPPPESSMQAAAQMDRPQESTFAAQAYRSRSQPDLRNQNAARQYAAGPSNQEPVFEVAGDIPDVPSLPAQRGYGEAHQPYPAQYSTEKAAYEGYRPYAKAQPPGPLPERQAYAQFDFNTPRSSPAPIEPSYANVPQRSVPGPAPTQTPPPSSSARSSPSGNRPFNPDALPEHPTPVRPGWVSNSRVLPPSKPPPIRQYHNNSAPPLTHPTSHPPPPIEAERRQPPPAVTHEELEKLQQAVKADPGNRKLQLQLVKKWAEAAVVLADNAGRADPRTRNKLRENFVMDAYKLLKKLANAGYPEAMFYLADCYGTGRLGLEINAKEAFNLYQSAAKAGHPQSAYRTAVCWEMGEDGGGGTRRDAVKAIQWYKKAASFGDTPAMYKMGMILLKGLLGQQKNVGEAIVWLNRAAERANEENPHALHELALLYESGNAGDNIPRDEQRSRELFMKAADLGYKFSQFRLGSAYEYGLMGCPIDPRTSIAWYSRAAAQEEHHSELALSGWYLTGSEGVLQPSDTEAYLWARRAAQAGLAKAEYAMGYFTEVGIGAPANLEEAKQWYRRAAAQNFTKARQRLNDLMQGGARVQQRERISRSKVGKQHEGECSVM